MKGFTFGAGMANPSISCYVRIMILHTNSCAPEKLIAFKAVMIR